MSDPTLVKKPTYERAVAFRNKEGNAKRANKARNVV
jgi:hypothetical protein